MWFSAHKTYGPKGIGALYVRRKPRVRIEAQMHGGGHERGMRSGTLPTHQIVGMGEAFRFAHDEMPSDNDRVRALRDKLLAGLSAIDETYVNGDLQARVPHNLHEFQPSGDPDDGDEGHRVEQWRTWRPRPSMRALGRPDELAHSSIRFTIGRFTTEADIDATVALVTRNVRKLRDLSPLWEMHQDGVDLSKVQWAAH
jgi:cysteine desulfurase